MFSRTIMSDKAARIFRFSAWWTMLASVTIAVVLLFPAVNPEIHSVLGVLTSLFLGIVGMVGGITSLVLLVGMVAHLATVSGYGTPLKAMWIAIFFLVLPLGEVIYFFVVYDRLRGTLIQGRATSN